jgi:hypothetical protein
MASRAGAGRGGGGVALSEQGGRLGQVWRGRARWTECYWLMAPEKRLPAWSSKSLCVVNDQPVGNPKRKV